MSDTIIKVDGLSKKYILSHQRKERYTALRDVIAQGARNFGRKILSPFSNAQQATTEEFFALKDVFFEIKQGDRVGIIGRNGAGKSTLLKILSRITEPTSGRIEITGRVASLLEVGTGFHPELTGRENIYLNGAILGMTRREIKAKFDEIVDFAEVEKFLDTPVKHFSSGMYVRLAFAVAAHLEPEILLVDEVLAVGDSEFQKKCLGKMEDVSAKEGRTVLFVSHNMAAINRLCIKGIWLQNGQVQRVGVTTEIVGSYLAKGVNTAAQVFFERCPDVIIQYRSVSITDGKGNVTQCIPDDRDFAIELEIEAYETTPDVYFALILQNSTGVNVLFADSRDVEHSLPSRLQSGKYKICLNLPPNFAVGIYTISLGISNALSLEQIENMEAVCSFEVVQNSNMQRAVARPGIINLHLPWNLEVLNG